MSGLLLAGAGWAKNDGIALYFLAFVGMVMAFQFFEKRYSLQQKLLNIGRFFLGFCVIIPWVFFQSSYGETAFDKMGAPILNLVQFQSTPDSKFVRNENIITPVKLIKTEQNEASQKSSLVLFYDYVIVGSSHGPFWGMFLLAFLGLFAQLARSKLGKSLIVFTLIVLGTVYYVFTFTQAYQYLLLETTIHRTLLQFSASAMVVLGYGLGLVLGGQK